jgi:hypothetical protein
MAYLKGEDINLGIGREATRGTYQAPTIWVPGREPTDMNVQLEKAVIRETTGVGVASSGSIAVQQRAEGSLSFNLRSSSIGYVLLSLLGKVTTSTVATGVYSHQFDILTGNPQFPTLSLAVSRPGQQDYKYLRCMATSLEVEFPVDDLVNATAEFVGGAESTNSSYTVSFPTSDHYFRPFDVVVKIASSVAGLSGATATKLKELSLSMTNGARVNQNISELVPSDVLAVVNEITGSFKLDADGETFHTDYVNAAYKAMSITLTRSDVDLGSSNPPSITFVFPKVTYEAAEPDRSLDDIEMIDVDWFAHFDAAAGYAVRVTVVNAHSSYAT